MLENHYTNTTYSWLRSCTEGACKFFIGCLLFLPGAVHAQSIGNWTFNNLLSGTTGVFNTIGLADFSVGIPIHSFNGGGEYYGEGGWPSGGLNTSAYLQFSLSANTGYQLDISKLVLRLRRSNTGSPAGAGPTSWSLRSSLDGFTSDIASGSMTHSYADYTVTPGSNFLNLYGTVVFRVYGYNSTVNPGGNSRLVVDNISVIGLGYLLPVKLGKMAALLQQDKVNVSFTLYNTEEKSSYSIERSADGIHYTTIHTIKENNSMAEKQYNYADDIITVSNTAQLFYRLNITGSTGNTFYSAAVVIKRKINQAIVKTSIRNNQLHINGNFSKAGNYKAVVYTLQGKELTGAAFSAVAGYNAISLPLHTIIPATSIIQLSDNGSFSVSNISIRQ